MFHNSDGEAFPSDFTKNPATVSSQKAMNCHRYNVGSLNKLLTVPSTRLPSETTSKKSDVIRIAWLRQFASEPSQIMSLLDKFASEGMDVWLVNGEHLPLEHILCFDLILLESSRQPASQIRISLDRIRSGSRAPLVLLTDDYSVQWSIDALQSGADAILPLNTSSDVVLARCRSLLRRWLSDV